MLIPSFYWPLDVSAVQQTEDFKVILRKKSISKDNLLHYNFHNPTKPIPKSSYSKRDSYIIHSDNQTIDTFFQIVYDAYQEWHEKNKKSKTFLHSITTMIKLGRNKNNNMPDYDNEEEENSGEDTFKERRKRKMNQVNPYFRELDRKEKHLQKSLDQQEA